MGLRSSLEDEELRDLGGLCIPGSSLESRGAGGGPPDAGTVVSGHT